MTVSMSRAVILLAFLLLAHASATDAAVVTRGLATSRATPATPVAGRVLVIDDTNALRLDAHGGLRAPASRLASVLARHGLTHGASLTRGAAPGSRRYVVLESSQPDFDPAGVAAELRASGLVRAAVPDVKLHVDVLPNDTYVGTQWWLTDGAARLFPAWDIEKGNASTRIGIMDTGVDLGHPDLASKIWTNSGEIPGNGLDDDHNGYVDDVHGWDFGDGDNDPNPEAMPDPANFDLDIGFHGTFVAGIAAAATNNGEGIAGAGWSNPIVPLKVGNAAAEITASALTEAFAYATAMHLEVLNISLGAAADPGVAEYFQALVDDAAAAGVLCVASAGNDGTDAANYPAACEHVLSVAATNDLDERSSFSNFGPTVDLAAPGEAMWSALCRNYEIDEFSQLFYEILFGWDSVDPYMGGDGTSFSAPLVSGVAALVRARHPGWGPDVVASHLIATGDFVPYDEPIGPRLNAFRAVSNDVLDVPHPTDVAAGLALTSCRWLAPDRVRVGYTLPANGDATLEVLDLQGRRLGSAMTSAVRTGAQEAIVPLVRTPAPGLCVVRLRQGAHTALRKLMVLR